MDRLSKEKYYLEIAQAVSKRSTCLKRRYGAVIVNNDEIVSTGYNGNPRTLENCCDSGKCGRLDAPHNSGDYSDCHSVHAEQNAIISAARKDMIGASLFLVGKNYGKDEYVKDARPCAMCKRIIINSGIDKIYIRNTKTKYTVIDVKEFIENDETLEGTLGY